MQVSWIMCPIMMEYILNAFNLFNNNDTVEPINRWSSSNFAHWPSPHVDSSLHYETFEVDPGIFLFSTACLTKVCNNTQDHLSGWCLTLQNAVRNSFVLQQWSFGEVCLHYICDFYWSPWYYEGPLFAKKKLDTC